MIMLAIFVAIASTVMEVKMVQSLPWLDKMYVEGLDFAKIPLIGQFAKFKIPGAIMNNAISLLLSGVCGLAFGAQGVIIMIGGMLSILLSNVYFSMKGVANKNGVTYSGVKVDATKKWEDGTQWWNENKIHFINLGKTIMALVKIVTAPIRAAIKINNTAHDGKDAVIAQFNTLKAKVPHRGSAF